MDISVIVPIWNVENYIERCLRSLGLSVRKQRECIKYFPEVDKYIMESKSFGWTFKIPYYLAMHGFLPIANIIFKFSSWIKRQK
ncbi:MAG: hypothetical protein R3Y15_02665 [Rikenellaceae bacterium]